MRYKQNKLNLLMMSKRKKRKEEEEEIKTQLITLKVDL